MLGKMVPKMVQAAQTRLKRVGTARDIKFKFGGYMGSSRFAHALLHIMGEEKGGQIQSKLSEVLLLYQFEREEDISCLDTLERSGVGAGLGEEEVRGWLAEAGPRNEVLERNEEQQRRVRDDV
ncbi:hypothetical protein PAAG_00625 [Paracoccidioides lutzii Pb01]|uniref:DSBA-like thioredoxin domain-containing protein n=1 Tax=Paracoccidioides lutzii (strain ATCC MYA-826 / Pb01) TaxID=502779 RepID=C1GQ30_PARBA|nr:hypothetical protein PAAG_00625 [Paracoccidioides lutzii Pb01]EEH36302.2 hypothetical protein PAAG_00625 [Paracoccidioides lutzii Pb01]